MSFERIEGFLDKEYPRYPGNRTDVWTSDADLQRAEEQIAEHQGYLTNMTKELLRDYKDRQGFCEKIEALTEKMQNSRESEFKANALASLSKIREINYQSLQSRKKCLDSIEGEMTVIPVKPWYARWTVSSGAKASEYELSQYFDEVLLYLNFLRKICSERGEVGTSIDSITVPDLENEEGVLKIEETLTAIKNSHMELLPEIADFLKKSAKLPWLRHDLLKEMDSIGIPTKDGSSTSINRESYEYLLNTGPPVKYINVPTENYKRNELKRYSKLPTYAQK